MAMEKNRHAREKFLRRRYARERWFVRCAVICIAAVALFLGGFLGGVVGEGWRGFLSSSVLLDIKFDSAAVGERGEKSALAYQKLIKQSLRAQFPQATERRDKRLLYQIASIGGGEILKKMTADNPELLGQSAEVWLPAGGDADLFFKGSASADDLAKRGLPPTHIARLQSLAESGRSRTGFNFRFFTAADSRNPELAGIGGALRGSLFTLMLTFLFSFPLAIFAAVYLEMFAPRNRWFDFLEININNLAAVPSVIFGLLGLAVFINIFNLPRSSSLVGGLVLSLMTLPTMIIAARAALKSAPPSLLAAALSLGATKMQGVFHHVLPAAMPGMLTGAIIGMAQALGETAPLLMIGMVAFIAEAPDGIAEAATALPVQIFLWADSPERGFAEKTASAIVALLFFLVIMNAAAVWLRRRLEIKW